jgi:hypothetical protein
MPHPHPTIRLALDDASRPHALWTQRDIQAWLRPVQDDRPRLRRRAMVRNGQVEALPPERLRDVYNATGRGYGG